MDINVFIYWLSWCALVTTIGLFFTGIPICMNIYRMKTTGDISGVPLLMGFLGGSYWLRYGFLKGDATMIQVNVVSSSLFFCYCIFYLIYAEPKKNFAVKFIAVLTMVIGMIFWMQYSPNVDYLGFLCMTFNIINFGAPLAGLGVVLKKKCTDSLPLPMCCCNLLVSSEWFLYGTLIRDRYIIIPNAIGMALAVIQLSLFIIFPRKSQDPSPIQRLFGSKRMSQNDYEKEPMNQRNEQNNSPVLGEPSFASTHSSSTLPSLYRKPDSESRLEKRLSNSFIEDSQQSEVHSEMRSRSNSVPELKLAIA